MMLQVHVEGKTLVGIVSEARRIASEFFAVPPAEIRLLPFKIIDDTEYITSGNEAYRGNARFVADITCTIVSGSR